MSGVQLSLDEIKAAYRTMRLIRVFEERTQTQYNQGFVGGFLHLYIGQEALATGAIGCLTQTDYVITTYRDHGHFLARGGTPRAAMAELFGKGGGCSKGLGGSMHMMDKGLRFAGGDGIVGGHIPVASGLGLAIQYRDTRDVVMCFMGEGATNIGGFHEGLNMAALWRLPVVYIVENNHYAIATGEAQSHSSRRLIDRGRAYGMDSAEVDGMDFFAVRETVARAVERARDGMGPSFIDAKTYRFRGHSATDPGSYRPAQEEEIWKQRDPMPRIEKALRGHGVNDAQFAAIEAEVKATVNDAIDFAAADKPIPFDDMMRYVYAEGR